MPKKEVLCYDMKEIWTSHGFWVCFDTGALRFGCPDSAWLFLQRFWSYAINLIKLTASFICWQPHLPILFIRSYLSVLTAKWMTRKIPLGYDLQCLLPSSPRTEVQYYRQNKKQQCNWQKKEEKRFSCTGIRSSSPCPRACPDIDGPKGWYSVIEYETRESMLILNLTHARLSLTQLMIYYR